MKHLFIALFFFLILCPAFGQNNVVKTAGVSYTAGGPTFTPGRTGSQVAIDTVTWLWYEHNGAAWNAAGYRMQTISGCSAPNYTPTKYQSRLVINACTAGQGGPELYYYGGSSWLQLNDKQTLSIDGNDLTLSDGGGTVTLPGGEISWPLLAPDGDNENPSYSFENSASGMWYSQDETALMITSESSSTPGVNAKFIFIQTGANTEDAAGGDLSLKTGDGANAGGSINVISGGGGVQGGAFTLQSGSSRNGTGGSFDLTAGSGGIAGGAVNITAGPSGSDPGGNVNITAGDSGDSDGGNIILSPGFGNNNGKVIFQTGNGVVFQNLTSSEVSSISSPNAGQTVFCTDATANDSSIGVLKTWNGAAWKNHW